MPHAEAGRRLGCSRGATRVTGGAARSGAGPDARAMITVHHLENSRSQRVLWMLEELGLPYEIKRYERNTKTMLAPPELKAVHPLGKSPVIEDTGANGGIVVAETGAIVEYLVDKADGRL